MTKLTRQFERRGEHRADIRESNSRAPTERETDYIMGYGPCEGRELDVQVWHFVDDEPVELQSRVLDISCSGVKLYVDRKLLIDESIGLWIQEPDVSLDFLTAATVRWVGVKSQSDWYCGCAFSMQLPREIYQRLEDGGYLERRTSERSSIDADAHVYRAANPTQVVNVQLQNYSSHGFRMTSRQAFRESERFLLEFSLADGRDIVIEAEVRWQSQVNRGYLVGCSFIGNEVLDIS